MTPGTPGVDFKQHMAYKAELGERWRWDGCSPRCSPRCAPRRVPRTRLTASRDLLRHCELGEVLGHGGFGTVLAGRSREDGTLWAVKVVNKKQALFLLCTEREERILKMVQHPHIIRLERVFDSPKRLFLVFERCHAELGQLLQQRRFFSEDDTRIVVARLCSAVSYMHRHDIVHRDLKLENLVVATNPACESDRLYIKVTDFGLSAVREGVGADTMLQDSCGTLSYMAPEVIQNKLYSQLCDVWAMGVIMFLLLSGRLPFTTSAAIRHLDPCFSDWPALPSASAVELIQKMLSKDAALRLTAAEVEMHSWIRGSEYDNVTPRNVLDMMRQWRTRDTDDSRAAHCS